MATAELTQVMKRETNPNKLERSAVHLLHRAGQVAGDIFSAEMSKEGLTPRQYAVLLTVAHNEGVSQTGLVERTGIDRSTLADVVRRMLRKGLLQRRRTKEDARAYAVRLTEEGWRVLKSAEPAAQRIDDRLLSVLNQKQRDQLLDGLAAMVAAFGAITPPAPRDARDRG